MATIQSEYQKFRSRNAFRAYDFDPGDTAVDNIPTDGAGWLDMRDYEGAICSFIRTVGTGVITFAIIANSDSDGGGTDATISTHAIGSAPDALMDQIHLEVSGEMLASLSTSTTGKLRYITSAVSSDAGGDEAVITWTRYGTKNAKDGLTADIVA